MEKGTYYWKYGRGKGDFPCRRQQSHQTLRTIPTKGKKKKPNAPMRVTRSGIIIRNYFGEEEAEVITHPAI
jgi:hypothetical protein